MHEWIFVAMLTKKEDSIK